MAGPSSRRARPPPSSDEEEEEEVEVVRHPTQSQKSSGRSQQRRPDNKNGRGRGDNRDDDEEDEDEEGTEAQSCWDDRATKVLMRKNRGVQDDDDDEEDEDMSQGGNLEGINESRMMLHDMIDTCQELDEKPDFGGQEDKTFQQQVKQSVKIFEKNFNPRSHIAENCNAMFDDDHSQRNSNSASSSAAGRSSSSGRKRKSDNAIDSMRGDSEGIAPETIPPSYMYLAYRHTNLCAQLMRKRTQLMGMEESFISVDGYVTELREAAARRSEAKGEDHGTALNTLLKGPWNTAPHLSIALGSFDHKEYMDKEKEKTTTMVEDKTPKRGPRRRNQFDPEALIATQEEMSFTQDESKAKSKANDAAVQAFRQSLDDFSQEQDGEPVNVFEFVCNKNDLRESLNNMFGVAFGVRDGSIAVTQEGSLHKITPCQPPPESEKNGANRRQCIISCSAATMKKLQAIAQGENAIKSSTSSKKSK